MTAVYGCINTVSNRCQLPINQLRYPKGQGNASTVMGTVLWTPYIWHLWGMADSPTKNANYLFLLPKLLKIATMQKGYLSYTCISVYELYMAIHNPYIRYSPTKATLQLVQ